MSFRTQLTLQVVFANKHEVTSLRDKRFFHYISPVPPHLPLHPTTGSYRMSPIVACVISWRGR